MRWMELMARPPHLHDSLECNHPIQNRRRISSCLQNLFQIKALRLEIWYDHSCVHHQSLAWHKDWSIVSVNTDAWGGHYRVEESKFWWSESHNGKLVLNTLVPLWPTLFVVLACRPERDCLENVVTLGVCVFGQFSHTRGGNDIS